MCTLGIDVHRYGDTDRLRLRYDAAITALQA